MKLAIIPEGPIAFDGDKYLYSEGELFYIESIAEYFQKVIVCAHAFKKGNEYYDAVARVEFRAKNIEIVELPLSTSKLGKYLQMLRVLRVIAFKMSEWDLVYVFLPGYSGAIASILGILRRKKQITYLASDWAEEASLLIPWKGWIGRRLYPLFHGFVEWVEGASVRNSYFVLTAGKALRKKHLGSGVPIEATVPRLNWSEIRITPRVDTCLGEEIVLLFVGYLIERKGARFVIEALALLIRKGRINARLKIAGEGDQRNELTRLADSLGISERVEFLGHLPNGSELFELYGGADIFLFSSFSGEGFPRVLYEAMSRGLPIITTNVCGIPEIMKDGINSLVIDPKSPEQMAYAVDRLIEGGSLRKRIIAGGLDFMERLVKEGGGGEQVRRLMIGNHPNFQIRAN